MNRRYRHHRSPRSVNYTFPIAALSFVLAACLFWFLWAKGDAIRLYFEGKTIYVPDNSEANENLANLLGDLAGDKAQLLDLAANHSVRLGWIKSDATRKHFLRVLMNNLLDKGQWDEALKLLPEVEEMISLADMERIATEALRRRDYELQLRLDARIQDDTLNRPEEAPLLLRSIRRTAESCVKMNDPEGAVKAISRLDTPAVLARFTSPELASEVADLQMQRADLSTIKEHPLQLVRNVLEQAKWPACRATARLMLEEVSLALRDNPAMPQAALKEIELKLQRCRDALHDYGDKEHKLPQCYLLLGELCERMGDYAGCARALTLAQAFAESYGTADLALQLRLARLRAKADMARGAEEEALADCRFIAEHETASEELMSALSFLAAHAKGEEREKLLARLWDVMKAQPEATTQDLQKRASIAAEISKIHAAAGARAEAIKWAIQSMKAAQEAYPTLTDGKALRASYELALLQRGNREDIAAMRRFRDIVKAIEGFSPEQRKALDAADGSLYRSAVREYARTCLLTGDRDLARVIIRKIHEDLPEKRR